VYRTPVPPSGGSLEIGNGESFVLDGTGKTRDVPPSGGSLEIGNPRVDLGTTSLQNKLFPLRGDP